MDDSFGTSDETGHGIDRCRRTGFLALPAVFVVAMIALAFTQPAASRWISEAAQAELAGGHWELAPAPTELAQPAGKIHPSKACRLIRV